MMFAVGILMTLAGAVGVIVLATSTARYEFSCDEKGEDLMPEKTDDLDKLLALVAEVRTMRAWQKKYYRGGLSPASKEDALIRSKQYERAVDVLLDEIDPPASTRSLFADEPEDRPGAYSR